MKTIGIRELKAGLSAVLRDVARGNTYLVTDRGNVVAELRQPGIAESTMSDEDRALARLAAAGLLRVAEKPRPIYRTSPVTSPDGLAKSLLDADRGE